jgi:hypothetical protein
MAYKKCRGNNILFDRYIRREQETWFAYQQALIDGDIMAYSKLLYSNLYADAKIWRKTIDAVFIDRIKRDLISINELKSYSKIYVKLQKLITNYELSENQLLAGN